MIQLRPIFAGIFDATQYYLILAVPSDAFESHDNGIAPCYHSDITVQYEDHVTANHAIAMLQWQYILYGNNTTQNACQCNTAT